MKTKCYVCAILSPMILIGLGIGLGMFLQQFIPWRLLEVVLWFGIYLTIFYKTLMFLLKWEKKNCR